MYVRLKRPPWLMYKTKAVCNLCLDDLIKVAMILSFLILFASDVGFFWMNILVFGIWAQVLPRAGLVENDVLDESVTTLLVITTATECPTANDFKILERPTINEWPWICWPPSIGEITAATQSTIIIWRCCMSSSSSSSYEVQASQGIDVNFHNFMRWCFPP